MRLSVQLDLFQPHNHPAESSGRNTARSTACHVAHNSGNDEWYTPPAILEAARLTMGRIDLDPASCEIANRQVEADAYFSIEDNGLVREWWGSVFLNPPYSRGLVEAFAGKLIMELDAGRVHAACVLTNNATDTRWAQMLLERACGICLLSGRVSFLDSTGVPRLKPLQGQMVMYFGDHPDRFRMRFNGLGSVW